MKKNKMMRLASFLLVAVLLTTSVISGTFAKYVTEDKIDDTGRVAIFGVEITTKGSLFEETYVDVSKGNIPGDSDGATGGTLTVKSKTADNNNLTEYVVAPGTKSDEDGLEFSVSGTPEVSVNVSMTVDASKASDIWLGAGNNLPNMTNGKVFDEETEGWNSRRADVVFNNGAAYFPIKYTLWHKTSTTPYAAVEGCSGVSLEKIVSKLDELSKDSSTTYAPGTNLAEKFGSYKITWVWEFDDAGSTGSHDKQDTLLGDLASDNYNSTAIVSDAVKALAKASKGPGGSDVNVDLRETTYDGSENQRKTSAQPSGAEEGSGDRDGIVSLIYYNLKAALEVTITVTQVD